MGTQITCADIVPSVIETMRCRNAELRPGIKYVTADACDMGIFADSSFDVVFDKSTLDALKCAGKSATTKMSHEIHRVLKDSGVYLCVSLNGPEEVQPLIESTECPDRRWNVQTLVCENEGYDGTPDGP